MDVYSSRAAHGTATLCPAIRAAPHTAGDPTGTARSRNPRPRRPRLLPRRNLPMPAAHETVALATSEADMAIERKQTNDRMSQIVIHGDTVYLAGQVALKAPGASVAEQTKAILDQIDELLAEAGTDKSKALSATIWLTDMATFNEMNEVWDAWAKGGAAPARACVESPRLAAPQFTVEIGLVAAR